MYDQNSRRCLEEQAGYEAWLISECAARIAAERGTCGVPTLVVKDTGGCEMRMELADSMSASDVAAVIREMSPLALAAAFKVLDSVIEWCLGENGVRPQGAFFGFAEKVRCLGKIAVWPDFLQRNSHLRSVVAGGFAGMRQKRNAIVHRVWGRATDGDLVFDYTYEDDLQAGRPRVHDTDTVPVSAVMALCGFASLLLDRLANPDRQRPEDENALMVLTNGFAQLHGQGPVQVAPERYFRVVRVTEQDTVDVDAMVNEVIKPQAGGSGFRYDLTIVRGNDEWQIPAADTGSLSGRLVLSELGRYRTTA